MNEFSIIDRYFKQQSLSCAESNSILLGIGDDCSLIDIPAEYQLAQSLDTLVQGVHFPHNCDPELLGYRALAVSVSDLAAIGAKPHSFILGLTIPKATPTWLAAFSRGLVQAAKSADITLIGGDTTLGPLCISVQVQGLISKKEVLLRSGAKVGDVIYVSGFLGLAAAALPFVLKGLLPASTANPAIQKLLQHYYQPAPQIKLGQWLSVNGATAAIDISDGLLADLGHILRASGVNAQLDVTKLPISSALTALYDHNEIHKYITTGGDDYELCFTWPYGKQLVLPEPLSHKSLFCIGNVTEKGNGIIIDSANNILPIEGYTHF